MSVGPSTAISHEIYTHPAGCARHGKSKREGKSEVVVDGCLFVCRFLFEVAVEAEGRRLISSLGVKRGPGALFSFFARASTSTPSTSTQLHITNSVDDQLAPAN